MKIKIYLITAAIAAVLAGLGLLIDLRISLGILLSAGFSLVNMLMLSQAMKSLIQSGGENYSVMIMASIIRFTLLLMVIYIAVKNPQLFSIYGVAAGFALFLIALIIDAVSRKGR